MSINVEFTVGEVRIHACTTLTARASSLSDVHWVSIKNQRGEEVTFFMTSAASAEAYASAINTCNDREADEAYIPNEYTVHIPANVWRVWRKLNMGVSNADENTDANG